MTENEQRLQEYDDAAAISQFWALRRAVAIGAVILGALLFWAVAPDLIANEVPIYTGVVIAAAALIARFGRRV